jgi:membrane protease YdiL (CAAX protease family)
MLFLGAVGAFAAWLYVGQGPDVAWKTVGGHVVTFGVSAALAGLIVLAASRNAAQGRYLPVALAALMFVNAMALTYAPLVIDGFPEFGTLNWAGKTLALVFVVMSFALLPAALRRETGILALPRAGSLRAVLIALGVFAGLGVALTFAGGADDNLLEQTAFQLTLPSLSEEFLFRGILLALFLRVATGGRTVLGAPLGAPVLATSLMFGLVHGFLFGPSVGFVFDPVPILATGVLGAAFAWLTLRSGSVWPAVIAHSLLNATGPALRLAGVV